MNACRWVLLGTLSLAFAAASGAAAIAQKPADKPRPGLRPGEINTPPARAERHADRLKVGDPAPDFTLADPSGKHSTTLSSFKGKQPVVLIFGSFTWPPFRRQSGDLERIYQAHKDQAAFLFVYIREAHPDSVLFTLKDGKEVLEKIGQTNTLDERSERAKQCANTLKLSMPAVVDKADNKVNAAYAGWPERLVVVGVDGKIAYYGGPGPGGFRTSEVEEWLTRHRKEKSR